MTVKNQPFFKVTLSISSIDIPFIFENKVSYLFPEMSEEDQNIIFKKNNNKLYPVKNYLFGENVVDPSIIKFNKLYWLFCSFKNRQENKDLYLFYSKTLLGNWTGHPLNPIIKNKSNNWIGKNR